MATTPTRRVIARTPRRASSGGGDFTAACRWCSRPVLWLRSLASGQLAPIDAAPAPGGNVVVHRDDFARLVGTYEIEAVRRGPRVPEQPTLALERADAYAELGGGLEDLELPDDVAPSRHFNHWATCGSATGRRLAAERARRGGAPGPLRTIDGDPVGPGHLTDPARIDPAGAQLSTPRAPTGPAPRRCRRCLRPLEPAAAAAGERYHPTCHPDGGFS